LKGASILHAAPDVLKAAIGFSQVDQGQARKEPGQVGGPLPRTVPALPRQPRSQLQQGVGVGGPQLRLIHASVCVRQDVVALHPAGRERRRRIGPESLHGPGEIRSVELGPSSAPQVRIDLPRLIPGFTGPGRVAPGQVH